jgi:hypothetical protein
LFAIGVRATIMIVIYRGSSSILILVALLQTSKPAFNISLKLQSKATVHSPTTARTRVVVVAAICAQVFVAHDAYDILKPQFEATAYSAVPHYSSPQVN